MEFVYSARPVNIGEKICLRFLEIRNFDSCLKVGFTRREPMSSVTSSNLDYAENMLNRISWTKILQRNLYKKGTLISYYVNPAGEVHFEINGENKGILIDGVDISVPLWVCLVIATHGTTLQLIDPRSLTQTESVNSVTEDLLSEMNILSFNDIPAYVDSKEHFDSKIDFVSYAFTESPLETTHVIFIKILKVEKPRIGSLSVGVTACDPATLWSSDLPHDVEMLLDRPEYWEVRTGVVNNLERDDELEVTMTVDREIQVSRNGAQAFTIMRIDNLEPFWAFVYTYGASQLTRIVTRRQISSPFDSETLTTSQHGNYNITHAKRSSSMTPDFGAKPTFQSPFSRLFNFGTAQTSTFGNSKLIASTSASFTNHMSTANTPNTNRNSNTYESSTPLTFLATQGRGIRVSEDGSTVTKPNGADMEFVYSARPVNVGEKVCLRLLAVGDFDSWFAAGFTSLNPMSPVTLSNPEYVENMSNLVNWMKVFKREIYTRNTIFCYYVNLAGEVGFEIDGEFKGILIEGVDISVPLWVCLIIAKYGTSLQFIDTRSLTTTETPHNLLNDLMSGMDILKFNNCTIRFDSETNHASYVFTEKPLETSEIIFIKILKGEQAHLGSLTIGITKCDPATLRSSDLPNDPEMLKSQPEYWVVHSDIVNGLEGGDKLEVTMTVNKKIQVSRNGAPALTVMDIDNNLEPFWVFVHTYGVTQQTKIKTRRQISNFFHYNKLNTSLLSAAKSVFSTSASSKAKVSEVGGLSNSNTSKVLLRAPKLVYYEDNFFKAPISGTRAISTQSPTFGSFKFVTSNSSTSDVSKLTCSPNTSSTVPVYAAGGTSTHSAPGGNVVNSNQTNVSVRHYTQVKKKKIGVGRKKNKTDTSMY